MNTVRAIYEKGVLRILGHSRPDLQEGEHVRLHIERDERTEKVLELAASVYKDLREEDVDEIERIALDRETFFGKNRE